MAFLRKTLLESTELTTSNVTYFTSPASTRTQITKMTICNKDSTLRTVSIYIVPSGQSVGDEYLIYNDKEIDLDQTQDLVEARHILEAGDYVVASCSANSAVNLRISGTLIT